MRRAACARNAFANTGLSERPRRTHKPIATSSALATNGMRQAQAANSAGATAVEAIRNTRFDVMMPAGSPSATKLPNSPRPCGACSTDIRTAPPHSYPARSPARTAGPPAASAPGADRRVVGRAGGQRASPINISDQTARTAAESVPGPTTSRQRDRRCRTWQTPPACRQSTPRKNCVRHRGARCVDEVVTLIVVPMHWQTTRLASCRGDAWTPVNGTRLARSVPASAEPIMSGHRDAVRPSTSGSCSVRRPTRRTEPMTRAWIGRCRRALLCRPDAQQTGLTEANRPLSGDAPVGAVAGAEAWDDRGRRRCRPAPDHVSAGGALRRVHDRSGARSWKRCGHP
jgi:hypothetical protein